MMPPIQLKGAIRRMGVGLLAATLSTPQGSMVLAADGVDDDSLEAASGTDERSGVPARSPIDKTLGGRQFWADVECLHQWRIQQNVLTGHFRLLDGDDYRHASGTRESCRRKLDEIRSTRNLPPMSG